MENKTEPEISSNEVQVDKRFYKLPKLLGRDRYWDLKQRLPEVGKNLEVTTLTFPRGSKIDFELAPTFAWLMARMMKGEDVVGLLSGGASGANIQNLKERLKKENLNFPTRTEEWENYKGKRWLEGNEIWQFQIGGLPFNDGSLFANWDRKSFVTQDLVLAGKYSHKFFGSDSYFCGLGVDKGGKMVFGELNLDVTSQEKLENSALKITDLKIFVGSPVLLVKNGRALDLEEILSVKTNGDPRHFWDLPYSGGIDKSGNYISRSGSILMPLFQDYLRSGKGKDLALATKKKEEVILELDTETKRYLDSVRDSPETRKEFDRLGINWNGDNEIRMVPKLGVYNHLVWGIKDGKLAIATTSGLLNGVKSAHSGVPVDALAKILVDLGFETAMFGCQGRDVPQVYKNGELVSMRWDEEVIKYRSTIDSKVATTPSIFVVL